MELEVSTGCAAFYAFTEWIPRLDKCFAGKDDYFEVLT